MSSVTYVVALLGPALAAASMTALLWLPFWLGIALLILAIPAISRLPDHTSAGRSPMPSFQRSDQTEPLLSSPILKAQGSETSTAKAVIDRLKTLREILASLDSAAPPLAAGISFPSRSSSLTPRACSMPAPPSEVPESPSRLHQGILERRQLGLCQAAIRRKEVSGCA